MFNEIFLGAPFVVAEMRLAAGHVVRDVANDAIIRMAKCVAVFAHDCVEVFGCRGEEDFFLKAARYAAGIDVIDHVLGDAGIVGKHSTTDKFHDVPTHFQACACRQRGKTFRS